MRVLFSEIGMWKRFKWKSFDLVKVGDRHARLGRNYMVFSGREVCEMDSWNHVNEQADTPSSDPNVPVIRDTDTHYSEWRELGYFSTFHANEEPDQKQ